MRRLERHPVQGKNSLHQIWKLKNPLLVIWQFLIISLCRILPSFTLKVWLMRSIRVKVGKDTAFGLMSMIDVFWPELITIGENCVLGYNCTILCHGFLVNEWRIGPVEIGRDVLIGANSTILAGVKIGDGAVIGAGTVVHKDVPSGAFVVGSPMQFIKGGESDVE